jgi:uncharacterized PurR-regulated membrane protein YhhQ (DUF165 family)
MRYTVLWVACYIATIFCANWAIETYGFVPVGFGLMAPAGVYFAGLAFTFRDLVHERVGVRGVLVAITIGAICSWFISPTFAVASAVAFTFSELSDLAVYTPLRRRSWIGAVALSNTVGLVVDSALFLWLAFGSLDYIAGQIVGKAWMTILAVVILWIWRKRDLPVRRRSPELAS